MKNKSNKIDVDNESKQQDNLNKELLTQNKESISPKNKEPVNQNKENNENNEKPVNQNKESVSQNNEKPISQVNEKPVSQVIERYGNSDKSTNTEDLELYKFVLDPLSVIIKLAIISKKKVGCKFSVYNNIIYIQENGIFQAVVRYFFKNNKSDMQYLYNPIELACKYFINKHDNIKNLFINAQKGLQQLIDTYKEHTIITHILYMYYNLIANYLNNNYNDKLFIKDNMSVIYTEELVVQLNTIWTSDKIKMVLDMIEFIDKDKGSEKSVKCLEEFMIMVDQETNDIMNQYHIH
jgi:hypothetical protein